MFLIPSYDGFDYSLDDGKISTADKVKNFGKGIIKPITAMFSSPKNFLIGAAGIIGGAALIAATGGAAAPVMVALGIAGGGLQIAKSAHQASSAKTDAEAEAAWQGMGMGTTAVVGSAAGSKSALKAAGIEAKGGIFSSAIQCFKTLPSQISKSFNAFKTGAFVGNFESAFKPKKNNKTQPDKKQEANTKPQKQQSQEQQSQEIQPKEVQPKNSTEQPKVQAEPKAVKPAETKQVESKQVESKPAVQKPKPSTAKTPDGESVNLEWNDNGTIKKSTIKGQDSTVVKQYDENGRIKFIETDDCKKIYIRDGNNRVTKIKTDLPEGEHIWNEYSYDNSTGRLTEQKVSNGEIKMEYLYDKNGKHTNTLQSFESESEGVILLGTYQVTVDGKKVNVRLEGDGNNYSLKGAVDNEQYGSIEMHKDTKFCPAEEGIPGYTDSDGMIKEALYIERLESAKKGRGAGTEMIKGAVQKSKSMGLEGKVFLNAARITDKTPVPFYYKLGFKATSPEAQVLIEQAMSTYAKTGVYDGPTEVLMYLPIDKIPEFLN